MRKREELLPRAILVLALTITALPVRADDEAINAARKAADGARVAEGATNDALRAVQDGKRAVNAAKQDANAKPSSDAARAAAQTAEEMAAKAVQKAEESNEAAKRSQAAKQKGDAAGAAAAAAEAGVKADEAKAAAAAAAAAAEEAKNQANAAESRLTNDTINNMVVPPTAEQTTELDGQSQSLDGAEGQTKNRRDDARRLVKQAADLEVEEEQKNENEQGKANIRKDGEVPLRVPFDAPHFFDVFLELDLPREFPNPDAPLAVPEVDGRQGQQGLLRLLLVNDNPFDVVVTDVEGFLFGDAIAFDGSTLAQLIPANGMLNLLLGHATFVGVPEAYTFADFSIITDSSHLGLGPEFSANFTSVPEPASFVVLLTGLSSFWPRRRLHRGGRRKP